MTPFFRTSFLEENVNILYRPRDKVRQQISCCGWLQKPANMPVAWEDRLLNNVAFPLYFCILTLYSSI